MKKIEHANFAKKLRSEGRLSLAGDYYVSSSLGYLMSFRWHDRDGADGQALHPPLFGKFATNLLLGCLCYRLSGDVGRCQTYCEIGQLIVEDIRENVPRFLDRSGARCGLCFEVIGDLQTVATLDSHDEAYEQAADYYESIENQHQWSVEPEFEIQIIVLFELAESVGYDLSDEQRSQIRYQSLSDRIQYKRDHFENIIRAVCEMGNWDSEIL